MSTYASPIEIAIDTRRVLMDGAHGVLPLKFTNLSAEEPFNIEVSLEGRILPGGEVRRLNLQTGGVLNRQIAVDLTGRGFAGEASFDVQLQVATSEGETHRFRSQFVLTILEHATSVGDVTVNIGRVIEQHGKGGMGSINEIDLKNLVSLPKIRTVNDFLDETRESKPHFVALDLEYDGIVSEPTSVWIPREGDVLSRCSLLQAGKKSRLLVLTGDSVTLGRGNRRSGVVPDIVTWPMPLNDENLRASQTVSTRHCRLVLEESGVFVENLSETNPTWLGDKAVVDRASVSLKHATVLRIASAVTLKLNPLGLSSVSDSQIDAWLADAESDVRNRWDWSSRNKTAGFLIERTDSLASDERYLWLFSAVSLPRVVMDAPEACLLAVRHLAIGTEVDALIVGELKLDPGRAVSIRLGDSVSNCSGALAVSQFSQDLGDA